MPTNQPHDPLTQQALENAITEVLGQPTPNPLVIGQWIANHPTPPAFTTAILDDWDDGPDDFPGEYHPDVENGGVPEDGGFAPAHHHLHGFLSTKEELGPKIPDVPMDIKQTQLSKIIQYKSTGSAPDVDHVFSRFIEILETNKIPLPKGNLYPIKTNGDTLVGIEIEVENHVAKNSKLAKLQEINESLSAHVSCVWTSCQDPSLRNNGHEWVSKPIKGKDVPKALVMLNHYLMLYYGKLDLNYRCGTHVHVDVRNFTVEQFINFVLLYILFEELFYAVSGNRRKNIFCVPIRASTSNIERIFRLVHKAKPTYQDFRNLFKVFKKYMAFNLLPAGFYKKHDGDGVSTPLGTIEFRHHEGSSDPEQLGMWVQMILCLHDRASALSFEEIKDFIFEMNGRTNYLHFAQKVFGTIPAGVSGQALIQDMYEGSAFIKEMFLMSKGDE